VLRYRDEQREVLPGGAELIILIGEERGGRECCMLCYAHAAIPYAHRLAILCLASLKHTMWLLQTSVCLSSLRTHKRNRARTSAIAHAQAQVEISACPYNRARVPHDRFQHLRFP